MAGAEFKLRDAIDERIFTKLEKIGTEANKAAESYAKLVKEMSVTISINPKGIDELNEKTSKYNNLILELGKNESLINQLHKEQQKCYSDITKELEKQVKQTASKLKQEAKEVAKVKQKIQLENERQQAAKKTTITEKQINQALTTQAKTLAEAARQNTILRHAVRNVNLEMDNAEEVIQKYNDKILENDKLMDKYADNMTKRKRNIGNYSSAFNGLGVSIQQVARELPSLSMGFNTFFLAISNNLPILADELTRAREANARLRKDGQQTIPVWRQITSSIFSWQTALVAGVTILSAYGKDIMEWAGNLFKAEKAANSYEKAVEGVNQSLQDNSDNYGETITHLKTLQDSWKDLGDSLQAKEDFIKNNGDLFDELGISVDDVNTAEKVFVENTPSLIEAIGLKSRATAAYNLAVEEETNAMKKRMEAEKAMATTNMWDYWNAGIDVITNLDAAIQGINMWNPEKYAMGRGGGLLMEADAAEAAAASYRKLHKTLKEQADALLQDSGFNLSEKAKVDAEKAKKEYDDYIKDIKEQSKQLDVDLIEDEHKRNIAAIRKKYQDRKDAIIGESEDEKKLRSQLGEAERRELEKEDKRFEEKKKELNKKSAEDEMKVIEEASANQIQALKNSLKEQGNELLKEHKGTESDERTHRKKMLQLTYQYNKAMLLAQIAAAEKELEIAEASNAIPESKITAMREKVRELKAEIEKLDLDFDLNSKKDDEKSEKERIEELDKALRNITESSRSVIGGFADMFDVANDIIIDIEKGFSDMWDSLSDEEKIGYVIGKFSKLASGLSSVMSAMYGRRIDDIEEEQEKLDEAANKEIERIEHLEDVGTISKEEAEARKRAAEDKTAKKNEELEKKKAALQMKQAKWDKANSIVQATIATALAVIKALPNLVLAGLVTAMGAAQIAAIIATPLPKYAKGTDYHKGGFAIVGDGGRSETILTESGIYLTPSVPTLVDIPRGAQVLPYALDMEHLKARASDLDALMAYRQENQLPPITIETDNKGVEKRLEYLEQSQRKGFKELAKAIKNQEFKRFAASI